MVATGVSGARVSVRRLHNSHPDGSTRDLTNKAGAATAGVTSPSHRAVSPNDCHAIFVGVLFRLMGRDTAYW